MVKYGIKTLIEQFFRLNDFQVLRLYQHQAFDMIAINNRDPLTKPIFIMASDPEDHVFPNKKQIKKKVSDMVGHYVAIYEMQTAGKDNFITVEDLQKKPKSISMPKKFIIDNFMLNSEVILTWKDMLKHIDKEGLIEDDWSV